MKQSKFQVVVGLLVFGGLIFLAIGGIWLLSNFLTDTTLGIAGAFIAGIFAIWKHFQAKKAENEARIFVNKAETYVEIMSEISNIFKSVKGVVPSRTDAEMAIKVMDLRSKMAVWSSYEVLNCFDDITRPFEGAKDDSAKIFIVKMGRLYSAMRKDLGHNDPDGAGLNIALQYLIPEDRARMEKQISS